MTSDMPDSNAFDGLNRLLDVKIDDGDAYASDELLN